MLEYCHWTTQEKLDALDHLTLAALMVREGNFLVLSGCAILYICSVLYYIYICCLIQEFVDQFKRQLFVEALVQGNITPKVSVATVNLTRIHYSVHNLPATHLCV